MIGFHLLLKFGPDLIHEVLQMHLLFHELDPLLLISGVEKQIKIVLIIRNQHGGVPGLPIAQISRGMPLSVPAINAAFGGQHARWGFRWFSETPGADALKLIQLSLVIYDFLPWVMMRRLRRRWHSEELILAHFSEAASLVILGIDGL